MRRLFFFSLFGCLFSTLLFAETVDSISIERLPVVSSTSYQNDPSHWVEATGEVEIMYDDINGARLRAIRQAIENAAMQVNAQVSSTQVLENGSLTVDRLRIHSNARVHQVELISEQQDGDVFSVVIEARVSERQTCATHMANTFRKSIAVTGFAMQYPEQSTLGHLGSVDRTFATYLVNGLNGLQGIRALDANYLSLYPVAASAPTQLSPDNALTQAVTASEQLGVQFIVSGVIRDLSMVNPDAPYVKPWDKWMEKARITKEPRSRRFVFDLYVHDGYSGALVFQSRYSAEGLWNVRHHEKVGFATAGFWSTDYGQQVQKLVAMSIQDLQQNVQCQPFMASISRTQGNRIYLASGASSGLRPGDAVTVYRTSSFFDRDQTRYTQITDTKLMATIKQVQPHFAIAELPVRVEQMNIQQDDLVIAW
jgi:hypothetical protein